MLKVDELSLGNEMTIAMEKIKTYFECHRCHIIDTKENWSMTSNKTICPECGKIEQFDIWPSSDVLDLIKHALEYVPASPYYGLVTSVFVCTAFELLLEKLLYIMALEDFWEEQVSVVIEKLIDAYQGRDRKLQLYTHVGWGRTFSEDVKSTGHKKFIEHWEKLVRIRNKSVHGDLELSAHIKPEHIETICIEGIDVFYKLCNIYTIDTWDYTYALEQSEHGSEAKKEFEKLQKWKDNVEGKNK